jgi:hypothetical protein
MLSTLHFEWGVYQSYHWVDITRGKKCKNRGWKSQNNNKKKKCASEKRERERERKKERDVKEWKRVKEWENERVRGSERERERERELYRENLMICKVEMTYELQSIATSPKFYQLLHSSCSSERDNLRRWDSVLHRLRFSFRTTATQRPLARTHKELKYTPLHVCICICLYVFDLFSEIIHKLTAKIAFGGKGCLIFARR